MATAAARSGLYAERLRLVIVGDPTAIPFLNRRKLVRSEFSNRLIPIGSEAWRHECEVAFFLGLPPAKLEEMLNGSAD